MCFIKGTDHDLDNMPVKPAVQFLLQNFQKAIKMLHIKLVLNNILYVQVKLLMYGKYQPDIGNLSISV